MVTTTAGLYLMLAAIVLAGIKCGVDMLQNATDEPKLWMVITYVAIYLLGAVLCKPTIVSFVSYTRGYTELGPTVMYLLAVFMGSIAPLSLGLIIWCVGYEIQRAWTRFSG